jgi:hypothetical protein
MINTKSRVEAGSNTSTVTLRVVGGNKKGTPAATDTLATIELLLETAFSTVVRAEEL